jgi:hypothetical protein
MTKKENELLAQILEKVIEIRVKIDRLFPETQTLEELSNEQKAEQYEDERFAERAERDAELEKFN